MIRRLLTFGAALATLLTVFAAPAQAAGGKYFYGAYANLSGARDYHGYVPSSYRPGTPMPLLVALHGCTENSFGFDLLTGFSALAEERGFIGVFPDQSTFANPAQCWNWTLPTNRHRGIGEPSIIAGITQKVRSQYTVDGSRVFATGSSAGAVMSGILGATYPDVYAAVAMGAGCEYQCDILGGRDPDDQGRAAYNEMGSRARQVPVLVFQGTADPVVPPPTARRGLDGGDVDTVAESVTRGAVPGGRTYTHSVYGGPGRVLELYMIDGAGHSYP